MLFWNTHKKGIIIVFAAAACLGFVLFNNVFPAFAADDNLSGRWFLTEGQGSPEMELLKDGTGIVDGIGITWKTENDRFYLFYSQRAEAWSYKVSGITLTLSKDDGTILKYAGTKEESEKIRTAERARIDAEERDRLTGKWYSEEENSTMELLKDGTGTIDKHEIAWKNENGRLYLSDPQHSKSESFSYNAIGSTLFITLDSGKTLKFEQFTAEIEEKMRARANANARASTLISDLRNAKACGILFFGDNAGKDDAYFQASWNTANMRSVIIKERYMDNADKVNVLEFLCIVDGNSEGYYVGKVVPDNEVGARAFAMAKGILFDSVGNELNAAPVGGTTIYMRVR